MLHLRNARHFTGHILRSIGLVVLVVVVLGLLHLEMDTVFDMNAIRNSTQFLSWRHRSNLQECTGLVGPGTPGVLVVIIAFLVLAAVGHSEHESNLRCWSLLGMSAILLILAVLVMGLTALVTRNAFAYPAGCFHPIRTKECGTFELLLLYAAALATFSAITRNRGTNPSGPAGLGGQKSPLPCSVEIGVVFTAEVLRAGIGLLGLTVAGHSLILRRCGQ